MRHLDLFSGIGGFALAARWMGWQTVAFCEIEPYPQAVLRKNFPGAPIFEDVRTLDATGLAELGRIDIVTGGFPCQDVSTAGKRAGLAGARSGLWAEMFRVVCAARPTWVVAENVPGLRTLGADRVLADLAEAGYAAWPLVVGAVHAGAPHRRQRVWIVAYAEDVQCDGRRIYGRISMERRSLSEFGNGCRKDDAANADSSGRQEQRRSVTAEAKHSTIECGVYRPDWRGWTDAPQPAVRRLDDGLPAWVAQCRVPALKALGNAIVPQVACQIFKAIEEADSGRL